MALRKRKTKNPCARCGLNPLLCICQQIPKLQTKTRLLLVIHARELKRTTNTGTLSLEALPNSAMRVRGLTQTTLDLSHDMDPSYQPLLYYPSDTAVDLNSEFMRTIEKPVLLIVPDGNWRQASKVHLRHKELAGIPRVMIKAPNLATHHLRHESTSYGMSTLEAIARAMGVIEGRAVEEELMALYRLKLAHTLKGRAGG